MPPPHAAMGIAPGWNYDLHVRPRWTIGRRAVGMRGKGGGARCDRTFTLLSMPAASADAARKRCRKSSPVAIAKGGNRSSSAQALKRWQSGSYTSGYRDGLAAAGMQVRSPLVDLAFGL